MLAFSRSERGRAKYRTGPRFRVVRFCSQAEVKDFSFAHTCLAHRASRVRALKLSRSIEA
jgi:hypothetical protein